MSMNCQQPALVATTERRRRSRRLWKRRRHVLPSNIANPDFDQVVARRHRSIAAFTRSVHTTKRRALDPLYRDTRTWYCVSVMTLRLSVQRTGYVSLFRPVVVGAADRAVLAGWVRASTVKPAGNPERFMARRARIVLLASGQRSNTEIASLVGVSIPQNRGGMDYEE